jgi:hypothetical protein
MMIHIVITPWRMPYRDVLPILFFILSALFSRRKSTINRFYAINVPLPLTYKVEYNHHIIKQKPWRRWQEVVISPPAIGHITNYCTFFLMMRTYRQAATASENRAFVAYGNMA